jgi:ABC-type bacteriocin/lantibiotic exporter with double-glycine peptidase domain
MTKTKKSTLAKKIVSIKLPKEALNLLGLDGHSHKRSFPTMKRVRQKTLSHCGPAVIEMLFSYLGKPIIQDEVVKAAKATKKLKKQGMTVKDMGQAVKVLAPKKFNFWYKNNSNIKELSSIINKYGFPVGVEWQGVFFENEDDDNGHYCIVTKIDLRKGTMSLSDPFWRFAGKDRRFSVREFETRWWDDNMVKSKRTGKKVLISDKHMLFIVTLKDENFPLKLGMKKIG